MLCSCFSPAKTQLKALPLTCSPEKYPPSAKANLTDGCTNIIGTFSMMYQYFIFSIDYFLAYDQKRIQKDEAYGDSAPALKDYSCIKDTTRSGRRVEVTMKDTITKRIFGQSLY